MKKISKLLSLVLAVVMLVGLLPMVSFAATGDWIEIPSGYRLASGITSGSSYLITFVIDNNNNYALVNGEKISCTGVTVSDGMITDANGASAFTIVDEAEDGTYAIKIGSSYLTVTGDGPQSVASLASDPFYWNTTVNGSSVIFSSMVTGNNGKTGLKLNVNKDGKFEIKLDKNGSALSLYEQGGQDSEYARLVGSSYSAATGAFGSAADLIAAVKSTITVYTATDDQGTDEAATADYQISGTVNPALAGSYTLTVSYKGVALGTIPVTVADKQITGVELVPSSGTVYRGAKASTETGAQFVITYDDDSMDYVPVKLQNVTDGPARAKTVGEYTGLTVRYDDAHTFTGFTLIVAPNPNENDYPEYPDGGSVRVNKTGAGIDFTSTGIAKVELSATGVPTQKGIDVIVMLDTSSSMGRDRNNNGTNVTANKRITMLQNSLSEMLTVFKTPNEDGSSPDIQLSVASFNGFTSLATGNALNDSGSDYVGDVNYSQGSNPAFFTGSRGLNADCFADVSSINTATLVSDIAQSLPSGTNYDYAFDTIYKLALAKKAANEEAGEERDLYVIFMSDGATFQYNYFYSKNTQAVWGSWLNGSIDLNSTSVHSANHKYFFNSKGERAQKHRLAEAIKGSPDETFEVIFPGTAPAGAVPVDGKDYMYEISGLGATMYSIGFCITEDGSVEKNDINGVIYEVASVVDGQRLYYDADNQEALDNSFNQITHNIRQAATNARFVDTMGEAYDIQLATFNYSLGGQSKSIVPTIEIKEYDIYKKSDIGTNGVTADMVGQRKGTSRTLEIVSFNEDGTEAYSSKMVSSNPVNILNDGVICAETFYYNTTTSSKTIDGITIAPETFYWKIGTIGESEIAMSYYVYLTGSMEGKRPDGSYPTNESAVLYYTNWLGNEAHKDTVSPVLPWGAATVSYAFYLVNENGEIIVNQTTGETGSFTNRVQLTTPMVYDTIYLNSTATVDSATVYAGQVLPEGYVLYNSDAEYMVKVSSADGSSWNITDNSATTYVTDYKGGEFTNQDSSDSSYDYTHTTVWFAVKFQYKCVPDAVVIDYGLPVDINVLGNDMFGNYGKLDSIALFDGSAEYNKTTELLNGFAKSVTGSYGTAALNDTKVRYTPASMNMPAPDHFEYAVKYANNGSANDGYYYGKVSVIPATTIYYEDSFVEFSGSWTDAGTAVSGATQAEDRPDFYNLKSIDANNLYGFDQTYQNFQTYSLGSAKKVNVSADDAGNWPTASFTFTGTAFDVISLTSKTTGFIVVEVTDSDDNVVGRYSVDNYYGYTYNGYIKTTYVKGDGGWMIESAEEVTTVDKDVVTDTTKVIYTPNWVVADSTDNAIYQIPVIKSNELAYGTYTVTIKPMYSAMLDHNGDDPGYDFYLDAIRIYNPAKGNAEAEKAYTDDKEGFPEYIELRNNLITANTFDQYEEDVNGIVFIDGLANVEYFSDYIPYGPNNQVYLAYGQSIAFKLSNDNAGKIASVQLAAHAIDGEASFKIKNLSGVEKTVALSTATDLYYDITNIATFGQNTQTGVIVITNTGSNIVALTNIKTTYVSDPNAVPKMKLMMSRSAALSAVSYVNTLSLAPAPAEEEEEEEEEEEIVVIPTFTPAKLVVESRPSDVKVGDKFDVKIKASADVKNVMVNGSAAKAGKPDKKTGEITWTCTLKASEVGELPIEVIAYDADHIASEPFITVRTVTEKKTLVKKILDAVRPGLK